MTTVPEGLGLRNEERTDEPFATFQRLSHERFTVTSADGVATVVASGDLQVASVQVNRTDAPAGHIGRAIAQATNEALEQAGRAGVRAMLAIPGLPDEVRQALEGRA